MLSIRKIMTEAGKSYIEVKTTVLVAIITFLIGGFLGDWTAYSKSNGRIDANENRLDLVSEKTSVMDNRVKNIEYMVKEIKSDVKDIKDTQNHNHNGNRR